MKAVAKSPDRIAGAAAKLACSSGLASLTVAAVAREAGVSSALVHYHYDTKTRLIVASANKVVTIRLQRRLTALAVKGGIECLDALWGAAEGAAAGGEERAWLELVVMARDVAELLPILAAARSDEARALERRLPVLLTELEATSPVGIDELAAAVRALLDGVSAAIALGEEGAAVRTSWDAFWLVLLAARPRVARR